MVTQQRRVWMLYIGIVIIVAVQFFFVLSNYETIESQKVFRWTIIGAMPIALIIGWFAKGKISKRLFYSHSKGMNKRSVSKNEHLKNVSASYTLFVIVACFLFYGSVIQTNDWFGTKENYTFNTKIINVKEVQHARYRRAFSSGNITYDIQLEYEGEIIKLSTRTHYSKGEIFDKRLNIGGFWGVIYED